MTTAPEPVSAANGAPVTAPDAADANITGRDPTFVRPERHGAAARFALRFIRDERDLPFIWLSLQITFILIPLAACLFVPGWFSWPAAIAYITVLFLGFVDRYILMLHNVSHRMLFKKKYDLLNSYIPVVLGPFHGETPHTYFAHHIGMHHVEENLPDDLSSTMRYQRDSLPHFLRYFFSFLFTGLFDLALYMKKRSRTKMLRNMLVGELGFYAVVAALCFFNWQATLVVFIIPVVVVRFLMMAGNWGQHAFIDAAAPENPYTSSITCINSRYNRRAFNDGYHIGHHVKATRHWTDMPRDFLDERERYAKEGAIVFRGVDFFMVWLYLMLGRYDWLANVYVDLTGTDPSKEEIISILKTRTKAIPA